MKKKRYEIRVWLEHVGTFESPSKHIKTDDLNLIHKVAKFYVDRGYTISTKENRPKKTQDMSLFKK